MDNYIVRIHRQEDSSDTLIRGIVEEVGKEERKLFTTLEELWDILNPQDVELAGMKGSD